MITYDGLKIPDAVKIQNELRKSIDVREREMNIRYIAGADISLNLYSTTIYAGIIVMSFPDLSPMGYSLVKAETRFPYVPGFLAFREVPALVKVWELLPVKPDLLVVDGHGIAHPRRLGIAAHFGGLTGQPSMGCAKKILFGKFSEPGIQQGEYSGIYDGSELLGYAYRSKSNVKPVFVSPGHKIGVMNSLDVISQCCGKYRIPEPTRLAHELVNRFRRAELGEGYREINNSLFRS